MLILNVEKYASKLCKYLFLLTVLDGQQFATTSKWGGGGEG